MNPLPQDSSPTPTRDVHCADAIGWMQARGRIEGACAVTSLPDVSEVNMSLPAWREWFLGAVKLTVDSVPDDSAALFFQSDIKMDGRWVDKGSLVVRAAEDAGAHVLFHKIIARRQPGLYSHGRPGFTHLIAVSRELRVPDALLIPDIVVNPGALTWARAMGMRAAAQAVRFALEHTKARTIFDPFCGIGTVLAVANLLGADALGVEKSRKRAEQARVLTLKRSEIED